MLLSGEQCICQGGKTRFQESLGDMHTPNVRKMIGVYLESRLIARNKYPGGRKEKKSREEKESP